MTRTTSLTVAALVAVTLAGTAAPAFAQDLGVGAKAERGGMHMRHGDGERFMMRRMNRMPRGAGILALACSDRGADRLEHMLLNIKQRADVTADQQPLFDALQSAALEAQAGFSAACAAARPETAERDALDLVDRLGNRLDIQKAHVAAMEQILPAFEAFYNGLTDAQKAALEPRRREHHRRDLGEIGRIDELGEPGMVEEPALFEEESSSRRRSS